MIETDSTRGAPRVGRVIMEADVAGMSEITNKGNTRKVFFTDELAATQTV